ncbi:MAG TPA: hypothetical protein VF339_06260 [Gammaproteobacteria bacterium]
MHDQLARLRVAVETGRLPRDLGEWLLRRLAVRDRRRRDAALRAAAERIGGSRWRRACELARLVRELRDDHEANVQPPDAAELVRAALEADPDTPASIRHMLRLLE